MADIYNSSKLDFAINPFKTAKRMRKEGMLTTNRIFPYCIKVNIEINKSTLLFSEGIKAGNGIYSSNLINGLSTIGA